MWDAIPDLWLLGSGGLIAIGALGWIVGEIFFLRGAGRAQGRVIEIAETVHVDDEGERHTFYNPVVEFEVQGRVIRFTSPVSFQKDEFRAGHVVRVRFNPARPEDARLSWFGSQFAAPLILLLIGLFVVALSLKRWFPDLWR